jgi:hypothetical protein
VSSEVENSQERLQRNMAKCVVRKCGKKSQTGDLRPREGDAAELPLFCFEGTSGIKGRKEVAARAQWVGFKYLDQDDAIGRPLDSDEERRTRTGNNRRGCDE